MNKRKWATLAGLLLALGTWATVATTGQGRADDDEDKQAVKEAQGEILKLMDTMAKGGNPAAGAAAIKKKFAELKPSMYVFKPRKNGGLGIGPPMQGDGIELKIINLSKNKPPSKAEVAKWADDYVKMAEVSKVMAEVAALYPPKKNVDDWKQYNDAMRKGADQLIAAAKKGDPEAIKKAATNLNASCTDCHSKFRDE
jgi:cytochrome c556